MQRIPKLMQKNVVAIQQEPQLVLARDSRLIAEGSVREATVFTVLYTSSKLS